MTGAAPYAAFLKLENLPVLLVGGGEVAFRKARALHETGCRLTVVAERFAPAFLAWATARRIECLERPYDDGEATSYVLAISATDDADVNGRVHADASQAGRLINVVDQPDLCNVFIPAVVRRGNLRVAISTNGACPALARRLRLDLEGHLPVAYGPLLERLGAIRTHVRRTVRSGARRKEILERILASRAVERFLAGEGGLLDRMVEGWKRARPR